MKIKDIRASLHGFSIEIPLLEGRVEGYGREEQKVFVFCEVETDDGTRAFGVQIASFRQAENAARGWSALAKRLQPLLDNVGHTVERADLGPANGIFHRLIAGPFPTRARADALCETIRKRASDCLVKPIPN